jgi:type VI secretion system protein ImpC
MTGANLLEAGTRGAVMPQRHSLGRSDVSLSADPGAEPVSAAEAPSPETPFRILFLGDFSGRSAARAAPPKLRTVRIDRDNVSQVMSSLQIALPLAGETAVFRDVDDFHPDGLFERLETFKTLRRLRERLGNDKTFAAAAAEMAGWASAAEPPPPAEPAPAPPAKKAGGEEFTPDDFLGQVLTETRPSESSSPAAGPVGPGDWQDWLRKIVAPHLTANIDYKRQARLVSLVDDVVAAQMRALLHGPAFQGLEAIWREVGFLVRHLETDEHLQIHLLDVSKSELAELPDGEDELRKTSLYRLLVEQSVGTAGGLPWAVLVGHYTFEPTASDAALLGKLSRLAQATGAPFLAAAADRCLGCASLAATPDPDDWTLAPNAEAADAWDALRRSPGAAWLGLALPRFLLRMPYGREADPVERFDFDEMPAGPPEPNHECYLWGNPAVLWAYLLAEAFLRRGWGFRPGAVAEVEGLPLHVYRDDGESQVKPCAEAWLVDRAALAVQTKGLMPLVSLRGRDAVRLAAFQSLALPARPLAGRWAV